MIVIYLPGFRLLRQTRKNCSKKTQSRRIGMHKELLVLFIQLKCEKMF